jgi:F-type H+-transporting ATPase subunit delta
MAENSTLARPYAEAVFEIANSRNELQAWSDMLQSFSVIVADPQLQALLDNPAISREQVTDLVIGVAGEGVSDLAKNMIKVLASNNRLVLLPEITAQFEVLKADAENALRAEVISAKPVSDAQQQKIAEALKKRLGREIELSCSIDESLIGGAIIRAGDLVIDGSAKGQLEKLSNALM